MQSLSIFVAFVLLDASFSLRIMNLIEHVGEEKIVGGQQIPLSSAPYQVSLQIGGYHQCGGAIISTTFILTAAHCTYLENVEGLSVRLATDQMNFGGEVFVVNTTYIHPSYNHITFDNDFSIIQLETAINLEPGVKETIALPPPNDPIVESTAAYVSGWGDTLNVNESNTFLRAATVPIIKQKKCKRAFWNLTPDMVCAGYMEGGVDACQV